MLFFILDDCLSHRVCLLLIELHIATFQPKKALNLINYIENQIINANSIPLLLSAGDREIKILKKDAKDAPKKKIDPATAQFQAKLLKYQIRCNLMLHELKAASRNVAKVNNGVSNCLFSLNLGEINILLFSGNVHRLFKSEY